MPDRAWELLRTARERWPMKNERIDLEEQIERCRRLRNLLTDEEMRDALEELVETYKARLKRQHSKSGEGFMLRDRD